MDNLALSFGGNVCMTKVALARGGTTTAVSSTGTMSLLIDGVYSAPAALSNQSIAVSITKPDGTTDNGAFTGSSTSVGGTSGSTRLYGIFRNGSGTVLVVPGPVCHSGELANGQRPLLWPAPQKGYAFLGAVRVAATAGTTFTPGTTALNAAGITDTYYDCAILPGQPLTS